MNKNEKTELNNVFENQMPKALEYATQVILETQGFLDFAVALVDFMGENFIPYCKSVYLMLKNLPHAANVRFDDSDKLASYDEEKISSEYQKFLLNQENKAKEREKEFKENIDELQFMVKSFRDSREFKKVLDFVGRFRYIAPYNAMLIHMQKPESQFVFPGKKWREWGRRPKPNAQKLIILVPFGPVQCVFEYSDTEPDPDVEYAKRGAELMEQWCETLTRVSGDVSEQTFENLLYNLPLYGVFFDETLLATNVYGGYIMRYEEKRLSIPLKDGYSIEVGSKYMISVNKNFERVAKFHTICHELGHLFCEHLTLDKNKRRNLSVKEREFEAETTAWLVCKRLGVDNPAEEYLATFAPNGEIPICSTERIMRAVTDIEKMLKSKMDVKDSLWYKKDGHFKKLVDDRLEEIKEKM